MKRTRFRYLSFGRNLTFSVHKALEVCKHIKHRTENPDRIRQGFSFANEPNKNQNMKFCFPKKIKMI
ncbi:hypothetical protein SAEN111111_23590 [Saccharibacillus endophyticus]